MLSKSLTLALLAALASASSLHPLSPANPLAVPPADAAAAKRQLSCRPLEEFCGNKCMPMGHNCCPGFKGSCDMFNYCALGSNDEYGCCPVGMRCVGEGGVTSVPRGGGVGGGVPPPAPTPTNAPGGGIGDNDDDDDDFELTPEPTLTDSDEAIPSETSGASGNDDDDNDDGERGFLPPQTTTTSRETAAMPTSGPGGAGDDDADDFDVGTGPESPDGGGASGAATNAFSFGGAIAAAVLLL